MRLKLPLGVGSTVALTFRASTRGFAQSALPRLNRWLQTKQLQRWRTVEASLAALQPHRLTVKKTESPTGELKRRGKGSCEGAFRRPLTRYATPRAEGFASFFFSRQANAATGKGNLQKASRNAAYGIQHGGNGDDGDTERFGRLASQKPIDYLSSCFCFLTGLTGLSGFRGRPILLILLILSEKERLSTSPRLQFAKAISKIYSPRLRDLPKLRARAAGSRRAYSKTPLEPR